MVTYVKRKLGDDVLSVELTKKEIWACFEEAACEYSRLIHETKIVSELSNVLGSSTSTDYTNKYTTNSLDFLLRKAEPYANEAFVGGSVDPTLGYFNLEAGRQDYNIYTELLDAVSGTSIYGNLPVGSRGKLKIVELFHVEPLAAQHFLLNASNITNFLATNFNYESYVNSTVFYVLPVFEDVLRRGMLEEAFRIRRSQYSYEIQGSKLRIFPIPSNDLTLNRLYCKVLTPKHPLSGSSFIDDSINGISGPNNFQLGNLEFSTIAQPGRQWIRQYTLALCKELLGLIRSKFSSIPIPNADLTLNGDALISQGREDKDKLQTQMKEFLAQLTHQKMLETDAAAAESLNKQLKYTAMPLGKAISMGLDDAYVNEREINMKTSITTEKGLVSSQPGSGAFIESLDDASAPFDDRWDDLIAYIDTGAGPAALTYEPYRDTGFFMRFFRHNQNDLIFMTYQMPHQWDSSTAVYPHMHYLPMSSGSGVVKFNYAYSWVDIGDSFPPSSGWTSGSITVSLTPASQYVSSMLTFGACQPVSQSESSIMVFKVERPGQTDPADTYETSKDHQTAAANLGILSFDLHYQKNKAGTVTQS